MTVTEEAYARRRYLKAQPPTAEDQAWATAMLGRLDGTEPTAVLLYLHRLREGHSLTELGQCCECDYSFLVHVEMGRRNASRSWVLRLAQGLGLTQFERDRLLVAAGFTPTILNGVGWKPELHELAQRLRREGNES